MARIAGINIPQNKLVHIGLTYIYGIGDKFSKQICKDLEIPKESVRRKVLELEKGGVIKKSGKKMFVNRNTLVATQAIDTLKDMSNLLFEFNILSIASLVKPHKV